MLTYNTVKKDSTYQLFSYNLLKTKLAEDIGFNGCINCDRSYRYFILVV